MSDDQPSTALPDWWSRVPEWARPALKVHPADGAVLHGKVGIRDAWIGWRPGVPHGLDENTACLHGDFSAAELRDLAAMMEPGPAAAVVPSVWFPATPRDGRPPPASYAEAAAWEAGLAEGFARGKAEGRVALTSGEVQALRKVGIAALAWACLPNSPQTGVREATEIVPALIASASPAPPLRAMFWLGAEGEP